MKQLYSLWITVPWEVKQYLQKIIADLREPYQNPVFEPHITLLGNISCEKEIMLQKATSLVKQLHPFPISLSEISFSTTYFQSVFVRIKSTALLMNAHMKAKEIYKMDNSVFMPHISLLYGDHTMEEREKIANETSLRENLSFTAEKIVVTPSTKTPNEWKYLAEFSLR